MIFEDRYKAKKLEKLKNVKFFKNRQNKSRECGFDELDINESKYLLVDSLDELNNNENESKYLLY